MSLEAAAGKNPINHVGKIYNVLAHEMASALAADLDVAEVGANRENEINRAPRNPRPA